MSKKSNLLIIEDHFLVSECVKSILQDSFDSIYISNNEDNLESIIVNNRIGFILLDLMLDDHYAFGSIDYIENKHPEIKVVVLSSLSNFYYIKKSLGYTVCKGYLSKGIDREALKVAVEIVLNGGTYNCPEIAQVIEKSSSKKNIKERLSLFTSREIEILEDIYEEKGNLEIASRRNISVRTVEVHKRNILTKAGVDSVVGLIKFLHGVPNFLNQRE